MAGIFSFIESFFFLSIGITFILILLLVYHFKQRLGILEQKSETIVSIVDQLTREMTYMKSRVNAHQAPQMPQIPQMPYVSQAPYVPTVVSSGSFIQHDVCGIHSKYDYVTDEALHDADDDADTDEEYEDDIEDDVEVEVEVEVEANEETNKIDVDMDVDVDEILTEFIEDVDVEEDDVEVVAPPLDAKSEGHRSLDDVPPPKGKLSIYELRALAVKQGRVSLNESTKLKKSELQKILDM